MPACSSGWMSQPRRAAFVTGPRTDALGHQLTVATGSFPASRLVGLVDGMPTRTVYRTFSVLDFDAAGLLDVVRLNNQQIARIEAGAWASRAGNRRDRPMVDAVDRFVARGGTWKPNEHLLRAIEAAALGQLRCPRVRVVG